jgi:hypothetical protein
MRLHVLVVLLLTGCPSSAIPGKTAILMESKRSTPIQLCMATPEFRNQLDQAVLLVGKELRAAGLISAREATLEGGDTPIACQIDQPEPCLLTPASCRKYPKSPRCARKRGCGHANGLWIARLWPPVCTSEWPDEAHCVQTAEEQSTRGFVSDLCKEVCEVFGARHTPSFNCYSEPQLSAFRRAAEAMR